MKRKPLRIAGLYLWEVVLFGGTSLWITTPTNSLERAIEKARKFLEKPTEHQGGEIKGITSRGTIDA